MNNLIDDNINMVMESLKGNSFKDSVPNPYKDIAEKFREVKEKNEAVIIEERGFPHTDSTVMYIDNVTDRWVGGHSIVRHEGETIKIPKTIHYSDIYMQEKSRKVKIIFEGANPYAD